jgi:hypothetical protein
MLFLQTQMFEIYSTSTRFNMILIYEWISLVGKISKEHLMNQED